MRWRSGNTIVQRQGRRNGRLAASCNGHGDALLHHVLGLRHDDVRLLGSLNTHSLKARTFEPCDALAQQKAE